MQLVEAPAASVVPIRSSHVVAASASTSKGLPPSTVSVTESMVTGSTLVLVIPTVKVTVAPGSSTEAVPAVLVTSMEGSGARFVKVQVTSSPGPTSMSPTGEPSSQTAEAWIQGAGVASLTE